MERPSVRRRWRANERVDLAARSGGGEAHERLAFHAAPGLFRSGGISALLVGLPRVVLARARQEIGVDWFRPYDQVLDTSQGVEWATWFNGGRLNIAHNCLDRHVATGGVAIVSESEDGAIRELTFAELHGEVNRLANALHAVGFGGRRSRRLCMPMVPEVVTILYACFKLGLIAVPIFAGFGAGAIATRLEDSVSAPGVHGGSPGAARQDHPAEGQAGRGAGEVLVSRTMHRSKYRGEMDPPWSPERDEWWHDFTRDRDNDCPSLPMDSESRAMHPLHLRHHRQAEGRGPHARGALAQMAKEIYLAFDHKDGGPVLLAVRHRLDDGPVDHHRQSQLRRNHLPV